MQLLLIDNYDSFTYNLYDYFVQLGMSCRVIRNDEWTLAEVIAYPFDALVISPGPKKPEDAGLTMPLIAHFFDKKPILGICLGHQAIAEAFGATLINLDTVYHGVATPIHLFKNKSVILNDLPDTIEAGRYHSWVVNDENLPEEFDITARDENNCIMGLKHKMFDVEGIQFHPESILTPDGEKIIRNWLKK